MLQMLLAIREQQHWKACDTDLVSVVSCRLESFVRTTLGSVALRSDLGIEKAPVSDLACNK